MTTATEFRKLICKALRALPDVELFAACRSYVVERLGIAAPAAAPPPPAPPAPPATPAPVPRPPRAPKPKPKPAPRSASVDTVDAVYRCVVGSDMPLRPTDIGKATGLAHGPLYRALGQLLAQGRVFKAGRPRRIYYAVTQTAADEASA